MISAKVVLSNSVSSLSLVFLAFLLGQEGLRTIGSPEPLEPPEPWEKGLLVQFQNTFVLEHSDGLVNLAGACAIYSAVCLPVPPKEPCSAYLMNGVIRVSKLLGLESDEAQLAIHHFGSWAMANKQMLGETAERLLTTLYLSSQHGAMYFTMSQKIASPKELWSLATNVCNFSCAIAFQYFSCMHGAGHGFFFNARMSALTSAERDRETVCTPPQLGAFQSNKQWLLRKSLNTVRSAPNAWLTHITAAGTYEAYFSLYGYSRDRTAALSLHEECLSGVISPFGCFVTGIKWLSRGHKLGTDVIHGGPLHGVALPASLFRVDACLEYPEGSFYNGCVAAFAVNGLANYSPNVSTKPEYAMSLLLGVLWKSFLCGPHSSACTGSTQECLTFIVRHPIFMSIPRTAQSACEEIPFWQSRMRMDDALAESTIYATLSVRYLL